MANLYILAMATLLTTAAFAAEAPPPSANDSKFVWDCDVGRNKKSTVKTRLLQGKVIELAKAVAKKEGYDLKKFNYSSTCFSSKDQGGSWTIFFIGVVPAPGNDFSVSVQDSTGSSTLTPGI